MRSYSVAVTSLAVGAPLKWTDNVISQHAVAGVLSAKRGIARRIPHTALILLALARELHVQLGMSVGDALRVAAELLGGSRVGTYRSGHVSLTFDLPALERDVNTRLAEALESAPSPRRGRPPIRRTT